VVVMVMLILRRQFVVPAAFGASDRCEGAADLVVADILSEL